MRKKNPVITKPATRRLCFMSLVLALMFTGPMPVFALDPPGSADISAILQTELPAWWSVRSVDIFLSVNKGDEVSPNWHQRFVADTFPVETLYLYLDNVGKVGPFTVLIEASPVSEVRRLYGTANSKLIAGKWSMEFTMESTTAGLGMPRSSYKGPSIAVGEAGVEETVALLLSAYDLRKTAEEVSRRNAIRDQVLKKFEEEELAALEHANQERLTALKQRFSNEREALIAANRDRLTALQASLEREKAEFDKLTAEMAEERQRLVDENLRKLADLKAEHEQERAKIKATAPTLDKIAEAKAETAAQKELALVLDALGEERKRTEAVQAENYAAQKQLYDAMVAAISSENSFERQEGLISVFETDDKNLKIQAFRSAFETGDDDLKRVAIEKSMESGDETLIEMALIETFDKAKRITIKAAKTHHIVHSTHWFDKSSFDRHTGKMEGSYNPNSSSGSAIEILDQNSWLRGTQLSISVSWRESRGYYSCLTTAKADSKDVFLGTRVCRYSRVGGAIESQVTVTITI